MKSDSLDTLKWVLLPTAWAGVIGLGLAFSFGLFDRTGDLDSEVPSGELVEAVDAASVMKPVETYSVKRAPFIHPNIVEDLTGSLSDTGDQVVAINVLDSQQSNRYFGNISVGEGDSVLEPDYPWVYSDAEDANSKVEGDEPSSESKFGYRYIGSTQGGIDVLQVKESGGGSGVFNTLLLIRMAFDEGYSYSPAVHENGSKTVYEAEIHTRELIRVLGRIPLGDRWQGLVAVEGNQVIVQDQQVEMACLVEEEDVAETEQIDADLELETCEQIEEPRPLRRVYVLPN